MWIPHPTLKFSAKRLIKTCVFSIAGDGARKSGRWGARAKGPGVALWVIFAGICTLIRAVRHDSGVGKSAAQ